MTSALTIGGAYIVGGFIPLSPYVFVTTVKLGFIVSALMTLFALVLFGCIKGQFTGARPLRSALQTVFIGGLAAAAAFAIARFIS